MLVESFKEIPQRNDFLHHIFLFFLRVFFLLLCSEGDFFQKKIFFSFRPIINLLVLFMYFLEVFNPYRTFYGIESIKLNSFLFLSSGLILGLVEFRLWLFD